MASPMKAKPSREDCTGRKKDKRKELKRGLKLSKEDKNSENKKIKSEMPS